MRMPLTPTILHSTKVGGQFCTVFLHGLLGNGKNLKTMATQFGGGLLLDLRGHGRSPSGSPPHTFENCAKDVLATVGPENPTAIVGHSFGGRVALECAILLSDGPARTETTTWLLDTVPGEANGSVGAVVDALQSINPKNYESRHRLSEALHKEQKLEMGLAQWLTSSATLSTNGLEWGFELSVVNALMPEFKSQDFMGKLEHLVLTGNDNNVVHLVRGEKNVGWTVDMVSKLQDLSIRSNGRFFLHALPKAGHWVHVDDLPGLVNLWEAYARQ
jgi:pimeloyl-ACP methyl ester carboxylesterase